MECGSNSAFMNGKQFLHILLCIFVIGCVCSFSTVADLVSVYL